MSNKPNIKVTEKWIADSKGVKKVYTITLNVCRFGSLEKQTFYMSDNGWKEVDVYYQSTLDTEEEAYRAHTRKKNEMLEYYKKEIERHTKRVEELSK